MPELLMESDGHPQGITPLGHKDLVSLSPRLRGRSSPESCGILASRSNCHLDKSKTLWQLSRKPNREIHLTLKAQCALS